MIGWETENKLIDSVREFLMERNLSLAKATRKKHNRIEWRGFVSKCGMIVGLLQAIHHIITRCDSHDPSSYCEALQWIFFWGCNGLSLKDNDGMVCSEAFLLTLVQL